MMEDTKNSLMLNGYERSCLGLIITCALNKDLKNQIMYYDVVWDNFYFNSDIRESEKYPYYFDGSYTISFNNLLHNTVFIKDLIGKNYKEHYIKMIDMKEEERLVYITKYIIKKYNINPKVVLKYKINAGSTSVCGDIMEMVYLSIKKKKIVFYEEYKKIRKEKKLWKKNI